MQQQKSHRWGKLESSSTKIVQCPGPVKFSSFQPPERVFCVFRETGFQFLSCDRFSFLRKSSAATYSFFIWVGSRSCLFCCARESGRKLVLLHFCVLVSCRVDFSPFERVFLLDSVLRFYQNSPALLFSRALLVFRALLRALGFQGLLWWLGFERTTLTLAQQALGLGLSG